MSGDYFRIQEVGGADLARHYPDRGPLADARWHDAVLHVEPAADGWLGWLDGPSAGTQPFGAVLSADAGGLRVLVPADGFAAYIPWAAAAVTAGRGWPATVVRLRAAAVPAVALVFNLDDAAADDLLGGRSGRCRRGTRPGGWPSGGWPWWPGLERA